MNPDKYVKKDVTSESAVSASYFKLFLQLAEEEGWEKSQILDGVNIDPVTLHETDYIGYADVNRLITNCQRIAQSPAAGLKLGQKLQLSSHGILGFALMGAPTHFEGLQVFKRFMKLRTQLVSFDMDINDENIFLYFDSTCEGGHVDRFMMEASLGGTCVLTRYLNDDDPVVSVHFSFAEPTFSAIYDEFFSVPVYYGCQRDCIVLRLPVMIKSTKSANPVMYEAARQQCALLLSQFEQNTRLTDKVKRLLLSQPEHFYSQQNLAEQLHMSTRSLRRQLKADGTSYQHVLDEVRCELAQDYLQKRQWSIDETAEMLGYSETANFIRAFRRWTGKTPAQIRSY